MGSRSKQIFACISGWAVRSPRFVTAGTVRSIPVLFVSSHLAVLEDGAIGQAHELKVVKLTSPYSRIGIMYLKFMQFSGQPACAAQDMRSQWSQCLALCALTRLEIPAARAKRRQTRFQGAVLPSRVLAVPRTGCPVLAVPYWLSRTGCPVL